MANSRQLVLNRIFLTWNNKNISDGVRSEDRTGHFINSRLALRHCYLQASLDQDIDPSKWVWHYFGKVKIAIAIQIGMNKKRTFDIISNNSCSYLEYFIAYVLSSSEDFSYRQFSRLVWRWSVKTHSSANRTCSNLITLLSEILIICSQNRLPFFCVYIIS